MKTFLTTTIILITALALVSCASNPEDSSMMKDEMNSTLPSIAEIAVDDGRFTTLVAALGAADLVDTLSGEGDFTVFAPTDDAFAKLPEGTIDALLNDIPALTDILLYHVVSGSVPAADVVGLDGVSVETLSGKSVMVKVSMGDVYINDSKVIITDIMASNGIIHVVDAVILPQM